MIQRYVFGLLAGWLSFSIVITEPRAGEHSRVRVEDELSPVRAENEFDEKARLVEQVLEASGIHRALARVPETVEGTLAQRREGIEPGLFEALRDAMIHAFDEKTLRESVLKSVSARLERRDIKKVLAWYGKPLAKKIRRLEVRATKAGSALEMAKFADQIQTSPPSDERVSLVQGILEQTRVADLTVEMITGITKGVLLGLNARKPEGKQLPETVYDREINAIKSKLRIDVKASSLVAQLFVLRELSEPELREYLDFLKSEPGAEFFQSFGFAVNNAFTAASRDTGATINRSLASEASGG